MQTLDLKGFQNELSQAKSVLVLMPENPSLDIVASATALSLALQNSGKEVTTACASPMLVEFSRLVGVNKVTDKVDNQNLTVSFQDYDAQSIERVSYNIEDGRFMLVVSPKAGMQAPNKDQVIVGYRGIAADVVILVGATNKASLGSFGEKEEIFGQNSKIALVNNTPSENLSQNLELVNPQATSVSEVALQVVDGLNLPLSQDISTNLFMGIRSGSNNFEKVTADTFAAAARLMNSGAQIEPLPQNTQSPKAQNETQAPEEWMQEPKVYKGTTLP